MNLARAEAAQPQPPTTGVVAYLVRAATSSLGAKVIMAVTGLLFLVWLALHLAGNLAMFAGQAKMNQYGHLLAGNPALLWGQRIGLLVIAGLHIASGLRLIALNKAARPVEYVNKQYRKASFASLTMRATALFLLGFFVFHLAHFTLGFVQPATFKDVTPFATAEGSIPDIYAMVVAGFRTAWIAPIYLVAMGCLALHLSHGFWSGFQSLGIAGKRLTPALQQAAWAVAGAIALGFSAIVVGVATGAIK